MKALFFFVVLILVIFENVWCEDEIGSFCAKKYEDYKLVIN